MLGARLALKSITLYKQGDSMSERKVTIYSFPT